MMEQKATQLVTILKHHAGKDFDATLEEDMEGVVGFNFMSYIQNSKDSYWSRTGGCKRTYNIEIFLFTP